MKSGTSRHGIWTAPLGGHAGRRASIVCAALGVLAIIATGMAPSAVADDVQSKQWYLDAMKADELWKVSTGKGIKVAVIDSGVNPATPSLKGQVLANEVPKNVAYHATNDYGGHGTTMAELIAGTGAGGGLQGLAPDSKIVPYRVLLGQLKDKAERQKTPEPAEAIRAAADTDAKIISMSIGGFGGAEEEAAVKYAASKGKLMFAAVGNDAQKGVEYIGYPAAYPGVVGVAASDESGTVGKFSQHGYYVDLAAPGLNLPYWCDATFRSYCDDGQGTSQATAITSASAALIWSAHPDWTANQVLRVLIDTAGRDWPKDTPSKYLGYGLIRPARNLLHGEGDPGAADIDPVTNKKTTSTTDNNATPSASASDTSQASKSSSGGETAAAGSSSKSSDGDSQLWVVLGAAAAVAVIGGGAFAVMRARRSG